MTFSITDWSVTRKWANVPLLTEFNDAVNERLAAAGGSPLPAVAAGDSAQVYTLIRSWQEAVESLLPGFVVSHAGGSPLAAGHYDGAEDIPVYADLAALFSAAGLAPRTTWRAYTTRPAKGGVDQARKIDPGDVLFGPLFSDLQKIVKVLAWTTLDLREHAAIASESKLGQSTYWHSTWAAAVAEAAAAYNAASATSTSEYPRVDCQGAWAVGNLYWSWIKRVRSKFTIPAGSPARSIDFYIKAVKLVPMLPGYTENVFDANSDDVIENKFSLWDTQGPTADAVDSSWIGSLALPDSGPGPVSQNHQWQGWCGGNNIDGGLVGTAILRWNVTGGFEYV
jgi:hypothetical protein